MDIDVLKFPKMNDFLLISTKHKDPSALKLQMIHFLYSYQLTFCFYTQMGWASGAALNTWAYPSPLLRKNIIRSAEFLSDFAGFFETLSYQ